MNILLFRLISYILLQSYQKRHAAMQEPVTTVISTKGQVILPKTIRDQRHWGAGTRLTVEDTPEGVLLKATPAFTQTMVSSVFGSLRRKGPALSLEDMDKAIAREAKRRARR
jgi:AbrB family looped-hinge helix DNA binding protein